LKVEIESSRGGATFFRSAGCPFHSPDNSLEVPTLGEFARLGLANRFVEPPPVDPELQALLDEVAILLKSVSITLVGDSGELNSQLALLLARLLEYSPVVTSSVVEQFMVRTLRFL
jgi:hypothetical protein